ncbi:MAG: hypothetical protein ACPGO3_05625 [Magnetospiraceae bacterium]
MSKFNYSQEYLLRRAFFVSGTGAWFRDDNDEVATSAVSDAKEFFCHTSPDMHEPIISGGTISRPEVILSLTWMTGGHEGVRFVSVSFLGHGQCHASWDQPSGENKTEEKITVERLAKLNLPNRFSKLRAQVCGVNRKLLPS